MGDEKKKQGREQSREGHIHKKDNVTVTIYSLSLMMIKGSFYNDGVFLSR